MPSAPHKFSSDRPIESSKDDKLGRAPFAAKLAEAIGSWRERDSIVFGLHGSWGSGKSSLVNLILEKLAGKPTVVIRFNPWSWSSQDQVQEAFFEAVGEALKVPDPSPADKEAALLWRRWSALFRVGATAAEGVDRTLPAILTLSGAALTALAAAHPALAVAGAVILALLGSVNAVFPFLARSAQEWADMRETRASAGAFSPEQRKARLAEAMQRLSRNVLVVIDDVDRLPPRQILQVFQLVKANADFPNLVYLMVMDRNVIVESLRSASIARPAEFLEKIVQAPFDVPVATRAQIDAVMFRSLDELLEPEAVRQTFDRRRWGRVYLTAVQPLLSNLRDVNRVISSLSVHIETLVLDGFLEVNIIDLIALETVHVLDPGLYEAIRGARDVLTRSPSHTGRTAREHAHKADFETIVASASHIESGRSLLRELFPGAWSMFEGSHMSHGDSELLERTLRVGSSVHFDKFLSLHVADGDISAGAINRLIISAGDAQAFSTHLQEFHASGRLDELLKRLEAYKTALPKEHATTIATGLFDIGDALSHEPRGFFDLSSDMHAVRVIYHFFKGLGEPERFNATIAAFQTTNGLSLPVHYLALEFDMARKGKGGDGVPTLSPEGLEAAKEIMLSRIRAEAADGRLWQRTHDPLLYILYRWREWSNADEVRQAVSDHLSAVGDDGALNLLRRFVASTHTFTLGSGETTTRPRLEQKALVHFLHQQTLRDIVVRRLGRSDLDEGDRKLLTVVLSFVEKHWSRVEGMPDDAQPVDLDDEWSE